MIWDSSYWKDDLLRRAKGLQRRRSQKEWGQAALSRVEQDLMLGFYSVRKLIEASKLSDAVAQQVIRVSVYPPTGKQATKLNWHKLDELFDLDRSHEESRGLSYLCHQFIHSYIFMVRTHEAGGLEGFCFASDRQRVKGLYYLPVTEVIRLFREVGKDYPARSTFTWDEELKDYRIESWTPRGACKGSSEAKE